MRGLFFSGVVFRVFLEVAFFPGFLDGLGQLAGQVGVPLQLMEIAGATRSERPLCAALFPLVNVPPPAIFAWITYSYVPSEFGVSLYVRAAVLAMRLYGPPTGPRRTL